MLVGGGFLFVEVFLFFNFFVFFFVCVCVFVCGVLFFVVAGGFLFLGEHA